MPDSASGGEVDSQHSARSWLLKTSRRIPWKTDFTHAALTAMASLEDRLRTALAPRILVEKEIGEGATSVVFEAHDPSLDRRVAVKVLRPQFGTARGAARFLREAQIIARLGHPNVIPVHEVGEAEGLYYYVMDLVPGETLRERLNRGALPVEEARAVGLDLLSALEAAHEGGVIHRDVKPENIFLVGGRTLLGDFGIAKLETTAEGLTVPGRQVGTPGYMAPEQARGETVTTRSDLYAAAAVIYEALTGHRWSPLDEPNKGDWSDVSQPMAKVLKQALAFLPEHRWTDATAFRTALEETHAARNRLAWLPAALATIALVALGWAYLAGRNGTGNGAGRGAPALPGSDLAILPCRAAAPEDSTLAQEVARVAYYGLDGIPDLRIVPLRTAARWWDATGGDRSEAATALRAERVLDCRFVRSGTDSAELWLDLRDSDGGTIYNDRIAGVRQSLPLGTRLTRSLLRQLRPREGELYSVLEEHDLQAVKAFFRGERDWERDGRKPAEQHFEDAVRIDPTFTLAWWRLADMRRWLASPPGVDLSGLLRDHGTDLPPRDAALLRVRVTPPGPRQYAGYERMLRDYPNDAYATLLYGDELLHRGPLWGVSQDSALRVLELATRKDSFLAPAFDHLFQAQIRIGLAESRATLDRLEKVAADPSAVHIYYPALWEQAYLERFDPEQADVKRGQLFQGPDGDTRLILASRYPLALNLPRSELALGGMLVDNSAPGLPQRTSGYVAEGLALMALGRPTAALARFDSAAVNHGGQEARLQAAQWRVIPVYLGFPGIPERQVAQARETLERIAEDDVNDLRLRAQAAWTLSLGDTGRPEAGDWGPRAGRLAARAGAQRLGTFIESLAEARGGHLREALSRSLPLIGYDSAGKETRPFLEAALYVRRGEWQERLSELDHAADTWAWHEHMDLGGIWQLEVGNEWSTLPRSGEVDWALGTHMRARRADLLRQLGRVPEACVLLGEVLRFWKDPEPGVREAAERARALKRESCPGGTVPPGDSSGRPGSRP